MVLKVCFAVNGKGNGVKLWCEWREYYYNNDKKCGLFRSSNRSSIHTWYSDTPYTNASVLFTWPLCETHIAHSNLVDLTMGLGEWAITMPMANGEGRGRDMNRGDMVADRTEVACNGELQLTEWLLPRSTIQDITANHSMVWRAFAASTILC